MIPLSRLSSVRVLAVFLQAGFLVSAHAAPWPSWRGPGGFGIAEGPEPPLRWDDRNGVKWKSPLPERGNSSPVIWGDRIFVTQAIEKENRRTLMCFDRGTGRLLWQKGVVHNQLDVTHRTNPHCSGSPATDGERVVVSFASAGLWCYDFDGNELWHRDLGPQAHIWGYGSSPVLWENLCFLNFGPGERTFLIAVDKRTGQTVWQHEEPGGHYGEPKPGEKRNDVWIGSWSDPKPITVGHRNELLMTWPGRACAYDPMTGKEWWTCDGLNPLVYTSPLYGEGIVVAMGGFNGRTLAVKPGGDGDVTTSRRLWVHPRTQQRIGSGIIHRGHVYIVNEPGIMECANLENGKVTWKERLMGPAANVKCWTSLVRHKDHLYITNQGGDTFVIRANPEKLEILALNSIGEQIIGSMAVADGEIYLRTYRNLWCLANAPAPKSARLTTPVR